MQQQTTNVPGKTELLQLMKRYNRIGLLLPRDKAALEDLRVRTSLELILAEMAQVRATASP
jgi:hypothetical protein